ncbi:MAG: serine O-acetyltransferase [Rhodospirillaceae bacterium]|nr:serine O-acetyltransferase [Rhodospirillaceae bacterium]MBT4490886.1 serine O-acetyltransferase [Rhodospirillaceae bacterium]MBT5190745.1 serine O-acetyltransferase [Rhodospirillaceae bacterium]MBT5897699.1 serine O-acetyltransferase [Rhodospirillaceae bacterium]MBT6426767.1 serine O-acetyltransferase [Rhodospirillaceae bacterium]
MMFKTFREDIAACMARDPAARSKLEVILAYPGFHAVVWYRLAKWFWQRKFFLLGRVIAHIGRMLTGIEIHPGATIGKGFFIDHGFGTVIGETAEIGDNVTLYHDVTLGGIAPSVDSDSQRQQKRHPTLCDDVIVGSGAQILGPITVGKGARVGANSVALMDVAPGTTVVGIPAKVARGRANIEDSPRAPFAAYGTEADIPDPVQRVIDALLDKVQGLSMQVEELERRLGGTDKAEWDASTSYNETDDEGDGSGCTDRNN